MKFVVWVENILIIWLNNFGAFVLLTTRQHTHTHTQIFCHLCHCHVLICTDWFLFTVSFLPNETTVYISFERKKNAHNQDSKFHVITAALFMNRHETESVEKNWCIYTLWSIYVCVCFFFAVVKSRRVVGFLVFAQFFLLRHNIRLNVISFLFISKFTSIFHKRFVSVCVCVLRMSCTETTHEN